MSLSMIWRTFASSCVKLSKECRAVAQFKGTFHAFGVRKKKPWTVCNWPVSSSSSCISLSGSKGATAFCSCCCTKGSPVCDDRSNFPPLFNLSHIKARCFFNLLVSLGIFIAAKPTSIKRTINQLLSSPFFVRFRLKKMLPPNHYSLFNISYLVGRWAFSINTEQNSKRWKRSLLLRRLFQLLRIANYFLEFRHFHAKSLGNGLFLLLFFFGEIELRKQRTDM